MALPDTFRRLLADPAPGLHFPAHTRANVPERILPVHHRTWPPALPAAVEDLRARMAPCPDVLSQLLDLYAVHDGVALCSMPDPLNPGEDAGLSLVSLSEWSASTDELTNGDWDCLFEGLEDMYIRGNFVVIGGNTSEMTRLVLFTAGEYEGRSLVGKIFCLSMDPVLSFTEALAESFHGLLEMFAADPAAFLSKIGYSHVVFGTDGDMYGAVPDRYVRDMR